MSQSPQLENDRTALPSPGVCSATDSDRYWALLFFSEDFPSGSFLLPNCRRHFADVQNDAIFSFSFCLSQQALPGRMCEGCGGVREVDAWCKLQDLLYREMRWALADRSPGEMCVCPAALERGVQHLLKPCLQINSSQCSGISFPFRLSPSFWFYSAVTQQADFCVLTCELPWEEVASRFE